MSKNGSTREERQAARNKRAQEALNERHAAQQAREQAAAIPDELQRLLLGLVGEPRQRGRRKEKKK